jgi:hypothetical protein
MSPDDSADRDTADPGLRLNLCPPPWEDGWADFRHREAVLRQLREELWRDGLRWQVEEFDRGGTRWTNWVCPESRHCWLCFETHLGSGALQLVQASFPAVDNEWSLRLASAVVRVICTYQLTVET